MGGGLEQTLFRIVQEALNNARKHAKASNVEVVITFLPKQVGAVIRDDGVGMDVEATEATRGSHPPFRASDHARARRWGQGEARDQVPARQGNGGPGDIRSLRAPVRRYREAWIGTSPRQWKGCGIAYWHATSTGHSPPRGCAPTRPSRPWSVSPRPASGWCWSPAGPGRSSPTSSIPAASSRRSSSRTAPWSSTWPPAGATPRTSCPERSCCRVPANGGHPAGGRPCPLLDQLEPGGEALGRHRQARSRSPGRPQPRLRRWCCLPASANARGSRRPCAPSASFPASTVAVGDGENDVPLFAVAGVSIAVANAVDALKARADVVLTEPNGRGVQSLAAALVAGDLGALTALSPLAG